MLKIRKVLETFLQRPACNHKRKQQHDHILLLSFIRNLVYILKFILKYTLYCKEKGSLFELHFITPKTIHGMTLVYDSFQQRTSYNLNCFIF